MQLVVAGLALGIFLAWTPGLAAQTGTAGSAAASLAAQATVAEVRGIVLDASGAPIPDARVQVATGTRQIETQTGADGRFTVAEPASGDTVVTVWADGFAEATARVAPGVTEELRLVLQPAGLAESVTVTASKGVERLATASSTTVVTSADLLNSAAGMVDDALRNTPGFSLFRRSSSRVANPTTQGVTLRGVSGSGSSRTLVLADGFPLNDAFGNWVYWNRIPQASIDRVEVVRGATGDLYGQDALGGVIQVLTLEPGRARVRGVFEGGSHDTVKGSVFAGGHARGWMASGAGEWLGTDGVIVIAEEQQGPVDVPAYSDYGTGYGALGYEGTAWHATGRVSYYDEDRGNGTPLVVNGTTWRQFSGEVAGVTAENTWQARVAGGSQDYYQTFSAITGGAARTGERLTTVQDIPTDFSTVSGQWTRAFGSHVLLVGGDGKWTDSPFHETRISATGVVTGPFLLGGDEALGSIFGRVSLAARDDLTIVLGARGDFWDTEPVDPALPTHSANFFSPRGSLEWRLNETATIAASGYRAYRTPSLNEIHRGFRAGNDVTNGNPLLEPERLTGFDAGVLIAYGRTSARITGFYNHLDDAIANITISTTPTQTTRQRQNAGKVRAMGFEMEADFRVNPTLMITGLAVFTSSTFLDTPKLPDIEGNNVPQVPGYSLGAGVSYADPRILTATAQLRIVGEQWEDDLNTLDLRPFAVLDVHAGRVVYRSLHAFVSVENLFDKEYDTGRTPFRAVGWPRTVRGGVRVFLP
jgi:outer membrane receptor protein involved in Fe transport